MADEGQQQQQGGEPNAEETFWNKLGSMLDERIDAGIQRTVEKYKVTGSSRNGSRTSIPELVANAMFGKAKSE